MSKHSWYVSIRDARVIMKSTMMGIRIIELEDEWIMGRRWITTKKRFGVWVIEGSFGRLADALIIANDFDSREHNPYRICNSLWHTESHGCHSACPSCGENHFVDEELKALWKGPREAREEAYAPDAEVMRI